MTIFFVVDLSVPIVELLTSILIDSIDHDDQVSILGVARIVWYRRTRLVTDLRPSLSNLVPW